VSSIWFKYQALQPEMLFSAIPILQASTSPVQPAFFRIFGKALAKILPNTNHIRVSLARPEVKISFLPIRQPMQKR